MRITRVEPIVLAIPYTHDGPYPARATGLWDKMEMLLVRVDTDEGITGWGEAFGFAVTPVTRAAIADIVGPMSVGLDPLDIDAAFAVLERRIQNMGRAGPVRHALSGIDIALWDILGKANNRPVHRLLGDAGRMQVPAYASFLPYGTSDIVERNITRATSLGYGAIKLHEHSPAVIARARAAAPDMTFMVDTNCAWNEQEARGMADALGPSALDWLEEPIYPPNDFTALARLRGHSPVRIAIGENIGSVDEAACAIAMGALDIIQPSVTKIGGLSEMRKVMDLAGKAGVRVQPHSPYFGPGSLATVHLLASMAEDVACERFFCDLEANPLGEAADIHNGQFRLSDAPGLGFQIDNRVLDRYRLH